DEAIRAGGADSAAETQAPSAGASPTIEAGPPRPAERLLQVHNSYVVTQDEQGIVIVDQHALHERAMFEYLLARVSAGALESQRLLMPIVVPSTGEQVERVTSGEFAALLARLGIELEALGPAQLALRAFPSFLFDRGVEPGPFVEELLGRAESDNARGAFSPGREEALHEVLDMMACKAAIKAGNHLSEPELADLLKLRDAVERSSNCPHGRPTSIRLTIRELEKRFGRT
ncbi:MAG: DNA mismatch repair protein MutL, partial [Phycisphaerales bacterium]|nr:DNA mismatch repair protein MutL [Phycisphaerales bacterium]